MTARVVAAAWVALAGAAVAARGPDGLPYRDITREAGITFTHHSAPEKKYIVESMSGGVALFDFDNDGLIDIYFVDSLTVDTANDPTKARSALYRNLGGNKFQDVTDRAGVGHPGWGMGVCTADVDADGWEDIYITTLGPTRLYRNNRNGTFTDVAETLGVTVTGWSAGCGFADYDVDGDLDLFVSRYVKMDLNNLPEFGKDKTCQYRGVAVQCGPRGLPGEGDFLFRNDAARFTDVSAAAGVSDPKGYFGLGVAWFDYNDDGYPDLFVANDSTPNFLYQNQKNGTFKEVAFPAGVAVSEDGAEMGNMGVAIGDYLNNGQFSVFVTTFSEEYNPLFRSEGPVGFSDVAFKSGVAAVSLPFVGWGTAFFDYDNNGLLDILAVNGHVYPQLDKALLGASAPYRQRRLFHRNLGNGQFDESAEQFGPVFTEPRVSRGLAVGDLDNDGRPDLVINDLDGPPQVLHNEVANAGHWLIVRLKGKAPNTNGIGAIVTARAGALTQKRVVRSGTSYISQDDMRQHFGLGDSTVVDSVEVRWLDGTVTKRENVKADQVLTVEK
jgi:hypothetical protein